MGRLFKIKMTRRQLYCRMLLYELIVVGFICFPPSVKWINRIEPHILGIPCFQFFILLCAVLIVLGLILWYVLENHIDRQLGMGASPGLDGQNGIEEGGETHGT